MKKVPSLVFVSLFFSLGAFAETQEFRLTAVETSGTKFWLPSTITVKKGDKVKLSAVSMIKDEKGAIQPHGLKIKEFDIEAVIGSNVEKFEFTAKKPGVYRINCHMHPPHIGAQLIVLDQ